MLHLKLYKYTNKPIIVDKTSYLGTALTVNGEVPKGNQDMENPVIYLASTTELDYNYAYIQEYNRYYYITKKIWTGGNVWEFYMHVDELYTYKALVTSISGLVAYSASGQAQKYDPRFTYNVPPVRTETAPASTNKDGGKWWIIMRTLNFACHYSVVDDEFDSNAVYYVMDFTNYKRFVNEWWTRLTSYSSQIDAMNVAIGNLIVDFSLVRWFDPTGETPRSSIRFVSPEINLILDPDGGDTSGVTISPTDFTCYMFKQDYDQDPITLTFFDEFDTYWKRKAERNLFIPFIGEVSFDLDRLGLGSSLTQYIGCEITYDFGANAYVLTFGSTPISGNPDVLAQKFVSSRIEVPNQLVFPFAKDRAVEMLNETIASQALGMLNTTAGGIVAAGITGGTTLPATIASLGTQAVNLGIAQKKLLFERASNITAQGSLNGGSPDFCFIETGVLPPRTYPQAYLEKLTVHPPTGYSSFQSDHGLPDGAYRTLTTGMGYVQMQEFEMIYNSNATKGEMDRLEQMLYKGVIL